MIGEENEFLYLSTPRLLGKPFEATVTHQISETVRADARRNTPNQHLPILATEVIRQWVEHLGVRFPECLHIMIVH